MGKKWTPDILVCYQGKFIAVEVKRGEAEKKRRRSAVNNKNMLDHSRAQYRHSIQIQNNWGLWCLACSVADIKAQMTERGLI